MLLEGVRLVEEALKAGFPPDYVLASEDLDSTERGRSLRAALEASPTPLIEVSPDLLAQAADTQEPQGILAIQTIPRPSAPEDADLLLLLDGIRDPGNLGTMMRSAAAAGVDRLLLTPGTVDPSNPKVVRAAMGAHFHLPVELVDWAAVDDLLASLAASHGRPLEVWLADAGGERAHTRVDWRPPGLLVIGGEAEGPSPEARERATRSLRIDMPGRAESLNAASAAAVLLFEALRQRAEPS